MEKKFIKYIENYYILDNKFNICKEILLKYKFAKKRFDDSNFVLRIDEIAKQDEEIKKIKKQLNDIFKI